MSLLYLFSPLCSEFNSLLHKLSHQFVIEDHHAEKSNEKKIHHSEDHDFLVLNPLAEAEDHHKEEIDDHTHGVISLFNLIFNYDSSKDGKEKQIFENKIDKHILYHTIHFSPWALVYNDKKMRDYFFFTKGHEPDITIPPPQSNFT
ncbi:hypothetical protein G3567_00035 [Psychroflexus sp. YR1-1]|uniref:Uncharacterized protein n=2 Tax=Psychroflexus aurantiacus TaxID=2709310 RepID=A0A6B3QY09_9FLAO|nr:hypothetical protein [Psychroflexus aurantiacus]